MTAQFNLFWFWLWLLWKLELLGCFLAWHIAKMLPRWLVREAVVVCGVHGTTGKYSHTVASKLTVVEALNRWETSNV